MAAVLVEHPPALPTAARSERPIGSIPPTPFGAPWPVECLVLRVLPSRGNQKPFDTSDTIEQIQKELARRFADSTLGLPRSREVPHGTSGSNPNSCLARRQSGLSLF